jgi:hypothetical protein
MHPERTKPFALVEDKVAFPGHNDMTTHRVGSTSTSSTLDAATERRYLDLAAQSSVEMAAAAGLQPHQAPVDAVTADALTAARAEHIRGFMVAMTGGGEGVADEHNEEDDEDEGMGAPCGTVESTWGGEASEWVLERIVKRRKSRTNHYGGRRGDVDVDDAGEADEDDAAWEYCCAWRGYAEATWERRGFLRDLGYGREVATYDADHKAYHPKARRHRQPAAVHNPWANLGDPTPPPAREPFEWGDAETMAAFVAELEAAVEGNELFDEVDQLMHDVVNSRSDHSSKAAGRATHALVGLALQAILEVNQVSACANKVTRVSFIAPTSAWPFLERIRLVTNANSNVRIVYHGTQEASAEAIAKIGLVVPGQGNGVTVANGCAYGVGIYTAESCETPVGYAYQGDLFVCLGNVKNVGCTNPMADWRIFTDRELVTPIIRLKFTRGESNNEPDGYGGRRFCPPEVVA